MAEIFKSPMSGILVSLEDVPDEVFSRKLLGDGLAILPDDGVLVAPVNGTIGALMPHACGIVMEDGMEILIHIGIDTVEMNGRGFISHVEKGQKVVTGQRLITFDLRAVQADGKSTISPVILIGKPVKIVARDRVKRGDVLMEIEANPEISKKTE